MSGGRSAWHATLMVGLLFGLAGCAAPRVAPPPASSEAAPTPRQSPFPSRPAELPMNGVDPCSLLTEPQLRRLGIEIPGTRADDTDELGSVACAWSNGGKPDNIWTARLVTRRAAEAALANSAAARVTAVASYGAVETASPDEPAEYNCVLVIDVAQGQSLNVKYNNFRGDYPGITHEIACALDRQAAEMIIGNLRALR